MTENNEFKEILKERAVRLSRSLAEPPKDLMRVVIFNVGSEVYGLEIDFVREILSPDNVTLVPGVARYVEGVTNLRGEIITVVDLRNMLTGEPKNEKEEFGEMIVAEIADDKLGMLVASVDGIYDIQTGLIDPPLTTLDKLKTEHLIGEFKFKERIVGLLNAAGVLETREV